MHNFQIVETYSDEARSGLSLRDRPGLRRLIEDVNSGFADFSAVLVFDRQSLGEDFEMRTRALITWQRFCG